MIRNRRDTHGHRRVLLNCYPFAVAYGELKTHLGRQMGMEGHMVAASVHPQSVSHHLQT